MQRSVGSRSLVVALLSLVACSGTGSGQGSVDAGAELADSYRVEWGPLMVQPGVERVQCVTIRLGNPAPMKVHQISNDLGDVSHHFIIYKVTDTEERREPYPCDSVENLIDPDKGVPLMITQKDEEVLTLPEGVGFDFAADQMLKLELHYINAGDAPKEVHVVSDFEPMPMSEFRDSADFVFMGNPDIEVRPGESATLGPSYLPMPWELFGAKLFGVTGHQHKWGTNVYVELEDNGAATPIYDLPNFNWDEPETVYYNPPMELPENGGFKLTCEWFNAGSSTAHFGEDVDDEMCFFWAYYYPSRGAITCFHTDMAEQPLDICCPGHQLCGAIVDSF